MTLAQPGRIVLLVEDHPANRRTLVDYLTAKGFRVEVAIDGLDALERVQDLEPAVVLMDVQMPKLDGLAVTRTLRADPRFALTPIIALTALAMSGDQEQCMEAGMTDYLSKPTRLADVHAMIEKYLAR